MSGKLSERDFIGAIESRNDIRLFFVFGQDESAAASIASALIARLGLDSEAIEIDSAKLRSDPALLSDEAASQSLFGGARHIRLHFAREEGVDAVANLLSAENAGNPVIATAGDLKKTSKLRTLIEGSSRALSYICYPPSEGEAVDQAVAAAGALGLRIDRTLAAQIVRYTGQDRRLVAMELEKLSLYYDSALDRMVTVEPQALSSLAAETAEEDINALVNQVLTGDAKALGRTIIEARAVGIEAIRIVRALQRRIALLAGMRIKVEEGANAGAVVRANRAIFWKEQGAFTQQVQRWTAPRLAGLNAHLLEVEAKLMATGADLTETVLEEELVRIARAAARSR
ncbi:MAG TPA: DNA polymerase III subunit delta [Sphingorhabdus sp.]|jgi:DNA polymerase-3 subunit delta|uniref:DNA polymerase III subunit delta n=1 Tax=Sphingorhabdus sp. TaxID=1902408 RepID=UPI002B88873D|nr:DNA polymerase III subunit delta [Sphingorhabdus sp.]HMT41065.1 DNA polymerase III subunit delta [Sphingorhabdus sp.]HMU21480.1 DNA polymerase III subunit delta [Sphingorhabdus sp.]